jgi:hypothetical protein
MITNKGFLHFVHRATYTVDRNVTNHSGNKSTSPSARGHYDSAHRANADTVAAFMAYT